MATKYATRTAGHSDTEGQVCSMAYKGQRAHSNKNYDFKIFAVPSALL